jgi:hypothetical protein
VDAWGERAGNGKGGRTRTVLTVAGGLRAGSAGKADGGGRKGKERIELATRLVKS